MREGTDALLDDVERCIDGVIRGTRGISIPFYEISEPDRFIQQTLTRSVGCIAMLEIGATRA